MGNFEDTIANFFDRQRAKQGDDSKPADGRSISFVNYDDKNGPVIKVDGDDGEDILAALYDLITEGANDFRLQRAWENATDQDAKDAILRMAVITNPRIQELVDDIFHIQSCEFHRAVFRVAWDTSTEVLDEINADPTMNSRYPDRVANSVGITI